MIYQIYCDSFDILTKYLFKTKEHFQSIIRHNNTYIFKIGHDEFRFVHIDKNKVLPEKVEKALQKTNGQPDYIVYNLEEEKIELVVEDTATAPIGNAMCQRMDKILPLFFSKDRDYGVVYLAPADGWDGKKQRSVTQNWLYSLLLQHYPDNFIFLDDESLLYERTFKVLMNKKQWKSKTIIEDVFKKIGNSKKIKEILNKALRTVKVSSDGDLVFTGKIRKPDKSLAHPIVSTALVISYLTENLNDKDFNLFIELDKNNLSWYNNSQSKKIIHLRNKYQTVLKN